MNKIVLIILSVLILASMACANDPTPQDNCKQLLYEGTVKAYNPAYNTGISDMVRFADGTEYNAQWIYYINNNYQSRVSPYTVIGKKYKLYVCNDTFNLLLVQSENTTASDDCGCK